MKRSRLIIGMMIVLIIMLFAGTAAAESGTTDGVSWSFENGILTIGNGENQVAIERTSRVKSDYGWHGFRDQITAVQCSGTIEWVGSIDEMFRDCPNLVSCDLSGFRTDNVTKISRLFYGCTNLTTIDWSYGNLPNLATYYSTNSVLYGCDLLRRVKFGEVNPLAHGYNSISLPNRVEIDGVRQYGEWIREDESYGPYSPTEFNTNYTSEMAGWWVFQPEIITIYAVYVEDDDNTLYFITPEDGVLVEPGTSGTLHSLDGTAYTGIIYPVSSVSCTWRDLASNVHHVVVVDMIQPVYTGSWFNGFTNCTSFNIDKLDFSCVTDAGNMFYSCSNAGHLNVAGWNTSSLVNAYGMFYNVSVDELDLTGWDVSSVTSMERMFYGVHVGTLNVTGWDVSNVTNAHSVFNYFSGHLIAPDLSWSKVSGSQLYMLGYGLEGSVFDVQRWSFNSGMNLEYLCCGTHGTINAQDWNLDGIVDAVNMFRNAAYPAVANLSGWHSNTLKTVGHMFEYGGLVSIDVSGWETPELTNMYCMFAYTSQLVTLIGLDDVDVSKVTDMGSLFEHSPKLQSISLPSWEAPLVQNCQSMFSNCTSLIEVDLSGFSGASLEWISSWFNYCTSMVSLDLSNLDVSHVTSIGSTFGNCSSLKTIKIKPWKFGGLTSIAWLFYGCSQLESIDLTDWDVSGITNMSGLFYNCAGLKYLDCSDFDTSNVTNMSSMFYGCTGLETLDISSFDTTNVTDETSMFVNCPKLQSVELGDKFKFMSNSYLPTPSTYLDGVYYTGKWIREDGLAGPYTPSNLYYYYTQTPAAMSGRWVWEKSSALCLINFIAEGSEVVGSMPSVTFNMSTDYTLPFNKYQRLGYNFDHWEDDDGETWENHEQIPGYTYSAYINDGVVNLRAVFVPRDTSVNMEDGSFEVVVPGNAKAVVDGVPAGTQYQVFENTENGWMLIVQKDGSGVVEACAESEAIFVNEYQQNSVSVQINGQKLLDDKPAEAKSFEFELWEDDELLETVFVGDGGLVQFSPIRYTWNEAGVHQYVIRELIYEDVDIYSYDTHEEVVTVDVHSLRSTVSHTDNIDDEGNKLGDFVNNQYYANIVTLPGVEKLHVQVTYSNPRGNFWVWNGVHEDVYTSTWSSAFNPGTVIKNYTYQSGKDKELFTDEFDVADNSLSILYYSHAYQPTDSYYDDMIDYGYYMVISDAELTADVTYDDSGILFHNYSAPGRLILEKQSAAETDNTGEFAYEIQLLSENGQAYELPDATLSYEHRTGIRTDYPDLATSTEKVYRLKVTNKMLLSDGSFSSDVIVLEHKAGEVFTVEELEIPGYYCQSISRDDVVRVSNGWQGFMPKHNDVMTVCYYPLRTYSGQVVWDDEENIEEFRPDSVTVWMMRGDDVVAYCDVSEPWEFSFENYPDYDNGVPIEYTFTLAPIEHYGFSSDGTTVTASHHRSMSRISKTNWEYYVNTRAGSSYTAPLTNATAFVRNTTYTSVDELPADARKISDSAFYYPTYTWKEGTTVYWWSEAEHVYLPSNCNVLFQRCYDLSYLDLSEFDFTYVTNMSAMFANSTGLQEIVFGEDCNTGHIQTMSTLFGGCSALTTVDFNHLDTLSATSLESMFRNCSSLAEVDVSSWNTENVTSLSNMFYGCTSLQTANCAGLCTSGITSLSSMFQQCKSLTSVNFNGWDTSNVTSMSSMFASCESIEELDLSNFNGQSVRYLTGMFSSCKSLRVLGLSGFNVSNRVTSYEDLFINCSSLPEVDLSGWDSSRVTDMSRMFFECSSLVNFDSHMLNTSKVQTMARMFSMCDSLTLLDLSGFDTSSLTDTEWMFTDSAALVEVDLSSWDTTKLKETTGMFKNCTSLVKVYVSELWDLTNVTSSDEMMKNCSSIVSDQGWSYAEHPVNNKGYAHLDRRNGLSYGYFWYKAAPTQSDDP